MEILVFLSLIIMIFLLFRVRSNQEKLAEQNRKAFLAIQKELLQLKNQLAAEAVKEAASADVKTSQPPTDFAADKAPPAEIKPLLNPTDAEVVQWRPLHTQQSSEKMVAAGTGSAAAKPPEPAVGSIPEPTARPQPWLKPKKHSASEWLRKNPDLEKFIGENLINKIGIAILVLGIAFFVKYAIDQDWINETGRVSIGIVCGIILIGIAHRLRQHFTSFSSVMAGGGLAVFYFTIAFAFHEYRLFSQPVAFGIMVVITGFAVVLALLYNKIELAIIAVIGGFLAPFLVSNGSNNYVALFTYLLILNTGMLIIAYFKKWPPLHLLSFIFTAVIFGAWLVTEYEFNNNGPHPNRTAIFFASAFYVLFISTALINNLRERKAFKAVDFSLMLAITAAYYAEGMLILKHWDAASYQGLFTLILAVVNLSLAWLLYSKQQADRNLLYLLVGLTVTFISLIAPIQLHGHSITLFWSAETVLLFWLYQRSGMQTFKYFSLIVFVAMMLSLSADWSQANLNNPGSLSIIFKDISGIVTNVVVVISLLMYGILLRKKPNEIYIAGIINNSVAHGMFTAAITTLYITAIFCVNLYFIKQANIAIPNAYHQLITYLFIAGTVWVLQRYSVKNSRTISVVLIVTGFIFYLGSAQLANSVLTGVLNEDVPTIHAVIHWLACTVMVYLFYRLINLFRVATHARTGYAWGINIMLFLFLSIEGEHLYLAVFAVPATIEHVTTQYQKAGLTIVWALFSFTIMWLGMKHKSKRLRVISLTIFTLALLKLFLLDIRNISAGGKIAAFIMLGVLLLIISFMYQRLKNILIDDEAKMV